MVIKIGSWHISISKYPTSVESWNRYLLKWARRNVIIDNGYINTVELIKKARTIWRHDTTIPEEIKLEVFSLSNLKYNVCDVLAQELKKDHHLSHHY